MLKRFWGFLKLKPKVQNQKVLCISNEQILPSFTYSLAELEGKEITRGASGTKTHKFALW